MKTRRRGGESGGRLTRASRVKDRRVSWAASLAVVVALAAVGVWWNLPRVVSSVSGYAMGRLPRGVRPTDLNLILVTLDTTRADRIGAYGFPAIETPHLDRLAREGVLFEQAISSAPLTLPAHSSIFTSKFPPAHGVRDNGGFFLDGAELTLAERLKARGFKTGGFVGAYVLDSKWGVDQGFDTYFDDFDLSKYQSLSLASVDRAGNEVADRALEWLEESKGSRFFAWVHFFDAHSPYSPPEPYRTRYADRPYAGEIAFVDSQVGRLLSWLEARDLLTRTVVVVMGDHGESLGEHGEATHGFFVYEAVVRVPFVICSPYDRMQGRRVEDPVRSVDVVPTVLDLLGEPPAEAVEGVSLVPLMTGARSKLDLEAYAEALYPRFHFGWSDLRAFRLGRFKYIAAPRPELYDLEQDPTETRNLYSDRLALADRLRARLSTMERRLEGSSDLKPAVEIDPDTRDRLAALGYVGTFAASSAPAREGASLADPKDKIELFNLITRAREASRRAGGSDEGIEALRRVTREDPNVIDAWFMLGNEYFRRRDFRRAIEHYARALALKPDYDLAVINMANAYRQLGEDAKAMAGYRRFMELDPKNPQIRYETAQILIDSGKLEEAVSELREALRLEPNMAAARNALGVALFKSGDGEGGEREIRAAIEQKPDVRLAHFNLALIAEGRRDFAAAVSEYRREMELHPASYKAQFNLGKLYGQVGNRPAELGAYRRAIEINPDFAEGHLSLAKLYLDMEQNLDEALALARRGLALAPRSEYAPLGHYVMADIHNRQGHPNLAAQELARARALEAGR